MEINKIYNHTLLLISASKEQINYLYKDIKSLSSNANLFNISSYKKSLYYINMARTLLIQLEKSFINIRTIKNPTALLIKVKNTYLQRCIFNYSMSFDYFKEIKKYIDSISYSMNKSLVIKFNNIKVMLDKVLSQIELLIKIINK